MVSCFFIFEMFRAKERTHGQARSLVCCGCGCKDFKSKAITNSVASTDIYEDNAKRSLYVSMTYRLTKLADPTNRQTDQQSV